MASYQEAYNNIEFEKLDKMAEKVYNNRHLDKDNKCKYLKDQKASLFSQTNSDLHSDNSSVNSSSNTSDNSANSLENSLDHSLENSLDNISISSVNTSNIKTKIEHFNNSKTDHLDFDYIYSHIAVCHLCKRELFTLQNQENNNSIFGDISTRDILLILLIIVVFVYVVKNILNK
jgi:hypothetical protein